MYVLELRSTQHALTSIVFRHDPGAGEQSTSAENQPENPPEKQQEPENEAQE